MKIGKWDFYGWYLVIAGLISIFTGAGLGVLLGILVYSNVFKKTINKLFIESILVSYAIFACIMLALVIAGFGIVAMFGTPVTQMGLPL